MRPAIAAAALCLAAAALPVRAAEAWPSSRSGPAPVQSRSGATAPPNSDSVDYQLDQQPPPPSSPQEKKPGFFDVEGRIKKAISEWFAELVRSAIEPVFKVFTRTVFATPRIDESKRVAELWRYSLAVADASLMLFVLVGAGMVTISSDIGAQLSAKEAIPRFFVAAGACNASLILLREMILLSNALSRGILSSISSQNIGEAMADRIYNLALMSPFLALLALFVIVMGILVAIAYVMRVAILVVINAAAPLLLITHALPHSENWAKIWWRANLSLLAVPVTQSFLLVAAFQVFLSGEGLLGWGQGGLIDLLVIGCILYMLFKIPFWGLDAALKGSGSAVVRKAKKYASSAAKLVAG